MPLAFTQEDFLVFENVQSEFQFIRNLVSKEGRKHFLWTKITKLFTN